MLVIQLGQEILCFRSLPRTKLYIWETQKMTSDGVFLQRQQPHICKQSLTSALPLTDSSSNTGVGFRAGLSVMIEFYTRLRWTWKTLIDRQFPLILPCLINQLLFLIHWHIEDLFSPFIPPIAVSETAFLAHSSSKSKSTPDTNSTSQTVESSRVLKISVPLLFCQIGGNMASSK